MRRFWIGLILAGVLAACGQAQVATEEAPASEAYGGMADMDRAQMAQEEAAPAAAPAPPTNSTTSAPLTLAGGPFRRVPGARGSSFVSPP